MAHNVTERDGLFTVRKPAWHGLGVVLPDYPTREQAQKIAHDWEPETEPVYRRVWPVRMPGQYGDEITYEEIPDSMAVVRSDTKAVLSVVSSTFTPVGNAEMYDIAEAIEGLDKGAVRFETGGSLKGGAKVWLLLRLAEPLHVKGAPHGATIPYYALQNSMDASGAFRGQATMTTIVCDNTAQMADLDSRARGTEFVFRHTKNVAEKIEEAKVALAGWRASLEAWQSQADHLVTVTVTPAQQHRFITEFVPMPLPHLVSDRVVGNVEQARAAIRSILSSATCEGIDLTAYGLVQSAIEYTEHARAARSPESRFKRAYLDRSTIVSDALKLALAVSS